MASFNSVIFLSLLVVVSALMATPSTVEAGGGDDENVINVNGTVPCAYNSTYLPNNTLAGRPFPNAMVELQCGKNYTAVARNTTDSNGKFSIILNPNEGLVGTYIESLKTIKNCSAVVVTPLSTCNANLTMHGTLVSPLSQGPINKDGDTRMFFLFAKRFKFAANQTTI